MCKCGRVSCHDMPYMLYKYIFYILSLSLCLFLQLWRRPTKWMWRYYPRRAAAPPFCVVWCPRLSRNWYEWSRGFMNPLSTSIPRCKAVSSEEEEGGEGTPYTHTHDEEEDDTLSYLSGCLPAAADMAPPGAAQAGSLQSASLSLCSGGLPSQQSALFVCSICLTCLPA